ncbi:hypothetical protein SAMN02745215_05051 [Desulfitobacterium chlororespirans DSM 11544]|uniref:Uncharacterized protein n=1 Tax=Desulfitobacterium chlororespirans DSM 11544 TaxID=1121395 RepID=A0A1M7UYB2_9FIRM|nr:hypothetical protein SAMN02745215_05051 [Desulfitobacterium chlororespirans DSM 11544]
MRQAGSQARLFLHENFKCTKEVGRLDKELKAIIKPYDNWFNDVDEETNLQAKAALVEFYQVLRKRKPDIR